MVNVEIYNERKNRELLLEGANAVADAVKVTMGEMGKSVTIEYPNGYYLQTSDGYRVASNVTFSDRMKGLGASVIKEAPARTVETAGDGTTSATVMTQYLMNKGHELLNNGANPHDLKRGMDKAVNCITSTLKKLATPAVENGSPIESKISQISLVSARGDKEVGGIVTEAIMKVGSDGMFDVESFLGGKTCIETTEGVLVDMGYQSQLFITNYQKQRCELDNPYILLYDRTITTFRQVMHLVKGVMEADRPLLIFCDSAEDEALATLVTNKMGNPQSPNAKKLKVCVVRCPSFGIERENIMHDIQHVVGGIFASATSGTDIEKMRIRDLGEAKKVVIEKNRTSIVGGAGDFAELQIRIGGLRNQMDDTEDEQEKVALKYRIAKLTGGVALIKVGGNSEVEISAKKDVVDDCLRAVRCACDEGFVTGGGATFLKIAREFMLTTMDNESETAGFKLVMDAIEQPFIQILSNAGIKKSLRFWETGDSIDRLAMEVSEADSEIGYNVKTGCIENLIETGIINPAKVERCAIENSVTVAGMFLTSGATIIQGSK